MAEAHIDHVSQLDATERNGTIVRLARRVRVTGLSNTDHSILFDALEECPDAGSSLADEGFTNLVLVERNPKLVDGDTGTVDVDLIYEHVAATDGQNIDSPPFGVLVGESNATLNQVTSNLDADGEAIVLSHTYPEEDDEFPDQTKQQGGEITYYEPQITTRFQGIKQTRYPWLIQRQLTGAVNASSWSGGDPHTWMCVGVKWKPLDRRTPNRYVFEFEFQYNPDTWNPTAVFNDERTGKPPVGLVEGTGYKYIRKHREVNFEQVIGTRIQGG